MGKQELQEMKDKNNVISDIAQYADGLTLTQAQDVLQILRGYRFSTLDQYSTLNQSTDVSKRFSYECEWCYPCQGVSISDHVHSYCTGCYQISDYSRYPYKDECICNLKHVKECVPEDKQRQFFLDNNVHNILQPVCIDGMQGLRCAACRYEGYECECKFICGLTYPIRANGYFEYVKCKWHSNRLNDVMHECVGMIHKDFFDNV